MHILKIVWFHRHILFLFSCDIMISILRIEGCDFSWSQVSWQVTSLWTGVFRTATHLTINKNFWEQITKPDIENFQSQACISSDSLDQVSSVLDHQLTRDKLPRSSSNSIHYSCQPCIMMAELVGGRANPLNWHSISCHKCHLPTHPPTRWYQ